MNKNSREAATERVALRVYKFTYPAIYAGQDVYIAPMLTDYITEGLVPLDEVRAFWKRMKPPMIVESVPGRANYYRLVQEGVSDESDRG